MRKKIKYIGIILIVCLILFFVFEHIFLVTVAKTAIKYVTDLDIHMNRVILNPFNGSIVVRGLKIFNPRGFKNRILASVPSLVINFNKRAIFEVGTFLDVIVIHIKEFNVIRNKDDVVNLSRIKALTPQEEPKEREQFLANSYIVKIEKVRYIDYTNDEKGVERIVDLGVNEEYKKVRNPDSIGRIIAFKIFFGGGLKNIGVNILKIQKDLARLAKENKKLAEEFLKLKEENEIKPGVLKK